MVCFRYRAADARARQSRHRHRTAGVRRGGAVHHHASTGAWRFARPSSITGPASGRSTCWWKRPWRWARHAKPAAGREGRAPDLPGGELVAAARTYEMELKDYNARHGRRSELRPPCAIRTGLCACASWGGLLEACDDYLEHTGARAVAFDGAEQSGLRDASIPDTSRRPKSPFRRR